MERVGGGGASIAARGGGTCHRQEHGRVEVRRERERHAKGPHHIRQTTHVGNHSNTWYQEERNENQNQKNKTRKETRKNRSTTRYTPETEEREGAKTKKGNKQSFGRHAGPVGSWGGRGGRRQHGRVPGACCWQRWAKRREVSWLQFESSPSVWWSGCTVCGC